MKTVGGVLVMENFIYLENDCKAVGDKMIEGECH